MQFSLQKTTITRHKWFVQEANVLSWDTQWTCYAYILVYQIWEKRWLKRPTKCSIRVWENMYIHYFAGYFRFLIILWLVVHVYNCPLLVVLNTLWCTFVVVISLADIMYYVARYSHYITLKEDSKQVIASYEAWCSNILWLCDWLYRITMFNFEKRDFPESMMAVSLFTLVVIHSLTVL